MRRRRFVATAGACFLAGCTGDSNNSTSSGDTDTPQPSVEDNLGSTETLSGENRELSITPTSVRLTDYLIGREEQTLTSLSPDHGLTDSESPDDLFLHVELQLHNSSNEGFIYPQGFTFESSAGGTHERVSLEEDSETTYNFPITYLPPRNVSAGQETTAWVAFVIPPSTEAGTLVADLELQGLGDTTVEWGIDVSDTPPERHEFDDLEVGETAAVGNDNTGLSITANEFREETGSFEVTSSGETVTAEAPPEGEKYVLVNVSVENIGEHHLEPVKTGDMGLQGDDWDTGALTYTGDGAYNRGSHGRLDPGQTKSGDVLLTAPSDAESYAFAAAVTRDIIASWASLE